MHGGIDGAVRHWEGSPAVRGRLEAIGRSSSSLVLFLEHVPQTLAAFLDGRRDAAPLPWVEESLARGAAFLRSRGLVHFDAHFHNVLTDGQALYFADFGLALSADFELSAAEAEFLSGHLAYDRGHTSRHVLRHHLLAVPDATAGYEEFLQRWIAGTRPEGVRPELAALLDRHAPVAAVMNEFRRRMLTGTKLTPFPAAELELALTPA